MIINIKEAQEMVAEYKSKKAAEKEAMIEDFLTNEVSEKIKRAAKMGQSYAYLKAESVVLGGIHCGEDVVRKLAAAGYGVKRVGRNNDYHIEW